jgi:hypothetical protein
MPKMDFPKFDGSDARIWVDGCESYFSLYDIPANFKVVSATLHMVGDAAHWLHAYKLAHEWPNWSKFREAVLAEFDRNVYRDRMKELMVLKQRGTVEEYRREFNQLVYQLRLYEPAVSETMLVTRFVMGLKEELKPVVEIQLPNTVSEAAAYAKVQEEILGRQKLSEPYNSRVPFQRTESRTNSAQVGDLWKALQLKEYRRANNLCFGCGEKFVPGHICAKSHVVAPTLAALQSTNGSLTGEELLLL